MQNIKVEFGLTGNTYWQENDYKSAYKIVIGLYLIYSADKLPNFGKSWIVVI